MTRRTQAIFLIIITILLTQIGVFYSYAVTFEYDENAISIPESEAYVPEEVVNALKNSNIDINDNQKDILLNLLISQQDNDILPNLAKLLSTILLSVILISVVLRTPTINNRRILSFLIKLSAISYIITSFNNSISLTQSIITNNTGLLSSITGSLSAIFLISGDTHSSVTASASLATLLTIYELILLRILTPLCLIAFTVFIAENIYEPLKSLSVTKALKKNLVSMLLFSFSFLLATISLNGSLATSKDSARLRGLKFAMANVIPIIGNSAGEALKTLTAEASGLRSTLGLASIYAILCVSLPPFIHLLLQKLILRFGSTLSSLICNSEIAAVFDGAADILDIFLAIMTAVTITSLFTLFVFTNSLPI